MTDTNPTTQVTQTFTVTVDRETAKYSDLILRQLIKQLSVSFYDLTLEQVIAVIESELKILSNKETK